MRKELTLAGALILAIPTMALAQHHGGGGGGGHGGGGGGGHMGGGGGHMGGGGGGHMGGGGGPHMGGGGGQHFGGGNRGGGAHFGGGDHHGGGHFEGGRQGGFNGGHNNGNVVVQEHSRTVVNNNFRGGSNGFRGGRGLPAGPGAGAWHRGWYGGHVSGFRPIYGGRWTYPRGYGYRRWGIGLILPSVLFGSAYYYSGWQTLGAYPPPPGDRWVRNGPDLLLVNIPTGRVDDAIYGAFY